MKLDDIKVGDNVRDARMWGRVVEVLKTRVKVQMYSSDNYSTDPEIKTYDRAHCQFLLPLNPNKARRR
jgi:hypothetical protein